VATAAAMHATPMIAVPMPERYPAIGSPDCA
jgi:hypothetical protein